MVRWDANWVNICESRATGDRYSITFKSDKELLPTNNLGMIIDLSMKPFELTRGMIELPLNKSVHIHE